MKYSLENYWKNIYHGQKNGKYINQSLQSIEIVEWHKKYIEDYIANQFKKYKPRVLDIGCCSGYLTNFFCNFSSEVIGLDYDEGFIIEAKSKYSEPQFLQGDVYNLNEIDGTFDLIVCFAVLQHISDLELVLKNIKSKLSTQTHSRILFTTINKDSIFNNNYFGHKLKNFNNQPELTLSLFSKEQFLKFSKISELKITKYEYLYVLPKSLGFLRSLVRQFLPSSFSHHIFIEMQHN